MKKNKKITAIILAAAMLCGCEKIPDNPDVSSIPESSVTSSDTVVQQVTDTVLPKEFVVVKQKYLKRFEAERGSFNGIAKDKNGDELQAPDISGYVQLNKGQYLTQVATATTSQFYRVIISARSKDGAVIKLQVGDIVEGSYFVPPLEDEDSEEDGFGLFAVDALYMSVGLNTLKLTVESGSADVDCIVVEDTDAVNDDLYRTGNACVSTNASERSVELMRVLSANYGKYTFTAQNVSCGTNAEIDAVYNETKRYPVIRASELALVLKDDSHSAETIENDLALAKEWDADGGVCAYSWHWYSPNSLRGIGFDDFDIRTVLSGIDTSELSLLDDSAVLLQLENGLLSQDAASLLKDLDKLAQTLKPFSDAGIPILFEPIPDGDSGLFWWGVDAETYKSLWTLVFDRLVKYNGIRDLIWVWNNSDFDYYPGDDRVDIIGQSFYERSNSSFAGRFSALASDPQTGRKMLAVTACDTLPSIDFMVRDNAMWLWTAADSGEYIIDPAGNYSDMYNRRTALRSLYNNEKCITRDELEELGY